MTSRKIARDYLTKVEARLEPFVTIVNDCQHVTIRAMSRPENWNEPADESSVRVSAGAPGSRPQPKAEMSPPPCVFPGGARSLSEK